MSSAAADDGTSSIVSQKTTGSNAKPLSLFQRRLSLPVSLVLQCLFAFSVGIVVVASCALFSSFVAKERVKVAQQLMQQLSSCSAERVDTHLQQSEEQLAALRRRYVQHKLRHTPSLRDADDAFVLHATQSMLGALAVMHHLEEWRWTASVGSARMLYGDVGLSARPPKGLLCNSSAAVGLQWIDSAADALLLNITGDAGWSVVVMLRSLTDNSTLVKSVSVARARAEGLNSSLVSTPWQQISSLGAVAAVGLGLMSECITLASLTSSVSAGQAASSGAVEAMPFVGSAAGGQRLQYHSIAWGPEASARLFPGTQYAWPTSVVPLPSPLNRSDVVVTSTSVFWPQRADLDDLISGSVVSYIAVPASAVGTVNESGILCLPSAQNDRVGAVQALWHYTVSSTRSSTGVAVVTLGVASPIAGLLIGPHVTRFVLNATVLSLLAANAASSSREYFTATSRSRRDALMLASATISGDDLDQGRVSEGVRLMVLISVVIGMGIIAAGSFFFHNLTRGLVRLAEQFARVSRFDVVDFDEGSQRTREAKSTLSASVVKEAAKRVKKLFQPHRKKSDAATAMFIGSITGSMFTELDGVCKGLRTLARHVVTLKRCVPSLDQENPSEGVEHNDEDMDSLLAHSHNTEASPIHVTVHLRYESRSTTKEFGRATFLFSFNPEENLRTATSGSDSLPWNKRSLYSRLVAECLERCGEDPFQSVSLVYVSHNNEHIVLRSSLQVLDVLSSCAARSTEPLEPPAATDFEASWSAASFLKTSAGTSTSNSVSGSAAVRLVMHKTTTPKVTVQLTSIADVFNCFSTIAFVIELFRNGDGDNPGVIAFCCFYVSGIVMNFIFCVVLIRQLVSTDVAFAEWALRRTVELKLCMFFSALNLQNFELIWTGIRVELRNRTWIFFNAPPSNEGISKSIQWSVVGFLFSDVTQLVFKIWRVAQSGSRASAVSLVTLSASSVSVVFNLAVKLHATFLWTRSVESDVLQTDPLQGECVPDVLADDGAASAAHTLVPRECSVVLVRSVAPSDVHQLTLLAVEWGQFYEAVAACAKKARATTLLMNSGMVVLAVNVAGRHPTEDHELEAIHLALSIQQKVAECSSGWRRCVVVSSGVFLTGVLGSFYKKATQVLCPIGGMSLLGAMGLQMESAASRRGVTIAAKSSCLHAFGVDIAAATPGETLETGEYSEGEALQLIRPATFFASVRGERFGDAELGASPPLICWPEFAFLFKSSDALPSRSATDSRPRLLSAAFGFSELNIEAMRQCLGSLLEHQWDLAGASLELPRQLPPRIDVSKRDMSLPLPASLSQTDSQAVFHCGPRDDDEHSMAQGISSEVSGSVPGVLTRHSTHRRTGHVIVSPKKLFGL